MRLAGAVGLGAGLGPFVATGAAFLVGRSEEGEAAPPAPPAPAAREPRHPPLSRREAQSLLNRWLADWAWQSTVSETANPAGIRDCGTRRPGRFVNESDSGTTGFRLFVLGYPDLAEAWALQAAENPVSPGWERSRALHALGILAEAGLGSAESTLARLGRHSTGYFRSVAVWWLSRADRSGAHRTLYRDLAREGDWAAAEALSHWPDPEAVGILQGILAGPPGIVQGYAQESLVRLRALESVDWHRLARDAILSEPGLAGSRFAWALRVAQERQAPWLPSTLGLRLDAARPSTLLRRIPPHLGVTDGGFDDALLALAEIGGNLSAQERRYLRHYGYGGDPRERLAEILAERGVRP